jgi:hypothetical protein
LERPLDGGSSLGVVLFCNKISLTIENKGNKPINTVSSKQPLILDLDVKGTPITVELLEKSPNNPELVMSVIDGNIVL